ncbi:MAG: phage tail tape measure C-terminal domain-containing protein [Methylococcaceae bacterium]
MNIGELTAGLGVDTTGLKQAEQQFRNFEKTANASMGRIARDTRLEKSWKKFERQWERGAKAYERLSAVQKKAVGSQIKFAAAIAHGGDRLKDMQSKLRAVKKGTKDAGAQTTVFQKQLHKMRANMMDYAIVAGIVALATKAAWDFTFAGAQINEQMAALDRLAAKHNTTSEDMIANLRRVSKETITNAQIVKVTGKALVMGIAPDTLTTLMEVATAAARTMGKTADEMFADITLGTARMSKKILDNIGIIVDWEASYSKHAATIGVTVNMLNEEEKMIARTNAIKEKGAEIVDILNTKFLTQRERIDQLVTSFKNVGDAAKQAFIDMIMPPEGIAANKKRIEWLKEEIDWIKKRHAQLGLRAGGGTRFKELQRELQALQALVGADKERISRQESLKKISATLNRNLVEFQKLEKEAVKESRAKKLKRQYDVLLTTFEELVEKIRAKGATAPETMVQGWIEARNKIKAILPGITEEIFRLESKEQQTSLKKMAALYKKHFKVTGEYGADFVKTRTLQIKLEAKAQEDALRKMLEETQGTEGEKIVVYMASVKKIFDAEKIARAELKAIRRDYTQFTIAQLQQELANENLTGKKRLEVWREVQERIKAGNIGMFDAFTAGSKNAVEQYGNDTQMMMDLGRKMTDSLTDNLGNAFFDMMSGAKNFKEAFKDMARGVADDVMRMISKMLALQVVQAAVGMGFSAVAWSGSGFTTQAPGLANGGVLPGGFAPIKGFANGDIVRSPTLGMVGEGRFNEAVVPLPNGREIPVDMRGAGGGGDSYQITINAVDTKSFFDVVQRNPEAIVSVVSDSIRQRGKLFTDVRYAR